MHGARAHPLPPEDPWVTFRRLARPGEGALFLDSNPHVSLPHLARASYAAALPGARFEVRDDVARYTPLRPDAGAAWESREPLDALRRILRETAAAPTSAHAHAPLPLSFPGGWAGLVSYDAARLIEDLPVRARDDTGLPQVCLLRFDAVVGWDHERGTRHLLARPGAPADAVASLEARLRGPARDASDPGIPAGGVRASLTQTEFERMVAAGKRHVRDGDVFQVNLSHRLEAPAPRDPLALYGRLREANPAPFAAYLDAGDFQIISSSPERLFTLRGGELSARPIAGTRRRGATPAEDEALKRELAADEKERAEHVMLVDLARNDIGRVAEYGSVHVDELLTVETYRAVHHLVSNVRGRLRAGHDAVDALRALFPGGTITGAPKVESMKVIESLEPVRRGAYTGSIGWFAPSGDCDLSILIRTLLVKDGATHLQVGAGVVEDSVPHREYQETLAKAKALLAALAPAPGACAPGR